MYKLPNKFEFVCKGDATTYTYENGSYSFYDCGHEYKDRCGEWQARISVLNGNWIITKNFDEPEMVFPFTFSHNNRNYAVQKESDNTITVRSLFNSWIGRNFPLDELKTRVKNRTYIVTSVGPQKPTEDPWLNEYCSGEVSYAEVEEEAVEPLNMDSVNRLTCAINSLTEAALKLNRNIKMGHGNVQTY